MLLGHRWKYSYDMRQYYCAPLGFEGVESYQWCVGCGAVITDQELYESGYPRPEHSPDWVEGIYLNLLALGKGYEPVEAGTLAEYKLRKAQAGIV